LNGSQNVLKFDILICTQQHVTKVYRQFWIEKSDHDLSMKLKRFSCTKQFMIVWKPCLW